MANRSLIIYSIKSLLREVLWCSMGRDRCELRGCAASCDANQAYKRQCFRQLRKVTFKLNCAPGFPVLKLKAAHGEPRGHFARGSNRGRRLAGNVPC